MNTHDKALSELERFAELEGSEVGEACQYLIAAERYSGYLSDATILALRQEIYAQLDFFRKNYRIVTQTVESKSTYEDLEWVGE